MKKLVVATSNAGKLAEFRCLFSQYLPQINCLGLKEFTKLVEPVEDEKDFISNARIKARSYFDQTGEACLADDSGLEVDFLNGAPGIFSARFAGEGASDQENNQKLLDELKGVEKREAQFRCALVLFDGKKEWIAQGILKGEILYEPQGDQGFGYNPIFWVPSCKKSLAQMSVEEKLTLDHRAMAFKELAGQL